MTHGTIALLYPRSRFYVRYVRWIWYFTRRRELKTFQIRESANGHLNFNRGYVAEKTLKVFHGQNGPPIVAFIEIERKVVLYLTKIVQIFECVRIVNRSVDLQAQVGIFDYEIFARQARFALCKL